jgi:predicted MFS family arabinose efflux permease
MKNNNEKLIISALALTNVASQPMSILIGLLLIEISQTFNVSVGLAGQIKTLSTGISILIALLVGALSIKYNHKSLLLLGLALLATAAIGCYLAPSFEFLIITYSFTGISFALISPMSRTLIGELLPRDKRVNAMGMIIAGYALAYLFGSPTIGYLAGIGGWRFPLITLILPITLVAMICAYMILPKNDKELQHNSLGSFKIGFREILNNRSALSCLAGGLLAQTSFSIILTYNASYFRQVFGFSLATASLLSIGTALSYISGSIISGKISKSIGVKNLVVIATFLLGASTLVYLNLPLLQPAIALCFLACFSAGTWDASSSSLTLEQVPQYRGTTMSLNSASMNVGGFLGASLGGLILMVLGYGGVGFLLGGTAIIASAVYRVFTVDPIKAVKLVLDEKKGKVAVPL